MPRAASLPSHGLGCPVPGSGTALVPTAAAFGGSLGDAVVPGDGLRTISPSWGRQVGTVLGTARTLKVSLGCTGVGCWAVGSRHCLHLWQAF